MQAWQTRPLDAVYPILYLDALVVKVKENGRVINKAVYLVIGVNLQGLKEVLSIWMAETEGAKFCLSIVTELQTRGVQDVFIAARSWQSNWARIVPMFAFTPETRRAIYTTNAIESLNFLLRKIIKNRALFPNDDAVLKILFLTLRVYRQTLPNWSAAMNQFAILFEERVPISGFGANSFTRIF